VLPRTRLLLIAGIACGLAIAGLFARNDAPLILSVPLFVYTLAGLISHARIPSPRLSVTRTLSSDRADEGDPVDVTVAIANRGPSLVACAISDVLPRGAALVEGRPDFVGSILSGETREIVYSMQARRGLYEHERVVVSTWSPLGLTHVSTPIDHASTFAAVPAVERLPQITIQPHLIHAFTGSIRARRGGLGVELYGCREFTPGDDIRRINWRASARANQLIINEYEVERMTDVNLVLDVRAGAHVRVGNQSSFEKAVRATASLAAQFIRLGNRVGLLPYGDMLHWEYPRTGRMQLERILRALARTRLANQIAFGELRRIPSRLFAHGSQIILLSSASSEDDARAIAQFAHSGYSVLLILLDTVSLERSVLPRDPAVELACRIARLKHLAMANVLLGAGVRVVNWDLTEPLGTALLSLRRTVHHGRP